MGCPSKNVVDPSKNLGNDLTVKTHISLVPTVSIWAIDSPGSTDHLYLPSSDQTAPDPNPSEDTKGLILLHHMG